MRVITLVPSYGRDYSSKKEVQTAWDDNKDFTIYQIGHPYDGSQINKEDAEIQGGEFSIRYKKKTKKLLILCDRKVV